MSKESEALATLTTMKVAEIARKWRSEEIDTHEAIEQQSQLLALVLVACDMEPDMAKIRSDVAELFMNAHEPWPKYYGNDPTPHYD